jgi:hypothetical protein
VDIPQNEGAEGSILQSLSDESSGEDTYTIVNSSTGNGLG